MVGTMNFLTIALDKETKMNSTKNPRQSGGGSRQRKTSGKRLSITVESYNRIRSYAEQNGHTMTGAFVLAIDRYYRLPDRPRPTATPRGTERQALNMSAVPVETLEALATLAKFYGESETGVAQEAILLTLPNDASDN